MLVHTFQHIRGIGKKTERALWDKGALSWDAYVCMQNVQLSFFGDMAAESIRMSLEAYEKGDMSFFAGCLPASQYYRVALTYPDETLFLDIETTGLSLYYDEMTIVGWSLGRKYGLYVRGDDPSGLLKTLESAKVIVTFNGTIFDLKFLEKTFPGIRIPPVHIDLRFLAKRVGLSGGQKIIESKIGFKRPHSVKGMEGESAPVLWYRYRRGDLSAFKRLIRYNHSDIEGMKCILDHAITGMYDLDKIPKSLQSKPTFSKFKSRVIWAKTNENNNPYVIHVSESKEDLKPLIHYDQLDRIVPLSQMVIVGIDLVSSEERESGYCILKGNKAETCRMKSDEEMIRAAQDAKAHLISIDSPLSIPEGRTSFFDDDPQRDRFGIMRECERILKRRGINVYPCLIPSMQKLTRRGIILAGKFRELGIPVIESYPGAAQDIIGIPRKRAGMQYLADALAQFGIICDFSKNISHDELDAITSAIVGIFFWTGKFEAIGNEDEEYLIIPDTNAHPIDWMGRMVIGLSGPIAVGKTTAASFLKKQGFHYGRFSIVLEKILQKTGITVSRKELQRLGDEINKNQNQRWLCQNLVRVLPNNSNLVIDGLRHPEDHAFLTETFGGAFIHINIECPESIRLKRYISDGRTKEEFYEAISHPVERNVPLMSSLAHVKLTNFSDLNTFEKKIFHHTIKNSKGNRSVCQ